MALLTGRRLERAQASRQFRDGIFHNTAGVEPKLQGNPLPVLADVLLGGRDRVPSAPLPLEDPREAWARPVSSAGLRVTWLGHSTLFLEVDGFRILTDPVFGDRASPLSFAGPRRFHQTPVSLEQLPPLDAVLLSHDHYDHLCVKTIRKLASMHVPIVTALGVGARLERLGVDPQVITELDWWEEHLLPGGELSFTATPAQHFSGRGMGDRNRTLWSSWVLRTAKNRLFFSGDTGLTEEFLEIRQRLGSFDLVMLEIGAWNPAWGKIHLGPTNAMRAFEMLGGGTLLPIHWSTFDLALHRWDAPAEELLSLPAPEGSRVITPPLGRAFEPAQLEGPTPWWRAPGRG